MTSSPQVWLVTGASSGFGAAIAQAALDTGQTVVATARRLALMARRLDRSRGRLTLLPMDVTVPGQVAAAVAEAVERQGRIDILVNSAGYGLVGGVEEADDDEVRAQFETNVFGLLRVTRMVLPVMRRQRSGHVINISSQGGLVAKIGSGIYNASKFAVEGISEALAMEAAHLGVRVTLVEPGSFRTEFLAEGSRRARRVIDDYDATVGRARVSAALRNGRQPGDPTRLAQAVLLIAGSSKPPLRLLLGRDALANVTAKLERVRQDLETWREVAAATDVEERDVIGGPAGALAGSRRLCEA